MTLSFIVPTIYGLRLANGKKTLLHYGQNKNTRYELKLIEWKRVLWARSARLLSPGAWSVIEANLGRSLLFR
jgi:hypothetical protein